uniref:DNA-directed RNA polymerase n=2 Tax=Chromera velia TaxID=505693 RepID=D9IXE8_9ALVE|nr:RNA polymerase beta'' subunit [Chromera velia]ADJ66556.1 RNA polymerase beta'' subunit [Chromera velia]
MILLMNNLKAKQHVENLILLLKHYGGEESAPQYLQDMMSLGFEYSTRDLVSINLDDLEVSIGAKLIEDTLSTDPNRGLLLGIKGYKSSHDYMAYYMQNFYEDRTEFLKNLLNITSWEHILPSSINLMSKTGARGTPLQLRQIIDFRGFTANARGIIGSLPVMDNFYEGIQPFEYFLASYGARKGVVDTGLRTADAGYLTRRFIEVSYNFKIKEEQCFSRFYLKVSAGNRIQGSCRPLDFLLLYGKLITNSIMHKKTGQILCSRNTVLNRMNTKLVLKQLLYAEFLDVKSPLTCWGFTNLCQACCGLCFKSKDQLHRITTNIGILAGQSVGEPCTQMVLRTFHSGGVVLKEEIFDLLGLEQTDTRTPYTQHNIWPANNSLSFKYKKKRAYIASVTTQWLQRFLDLLVRLPSSSFDPRIPDWLSRLQFKVRPSNLYLTLTNEYGAFISLSDVEKGSVTGPLPYWPKGWGIGVSTQSRLMTTHSVPSSPSLRAWNLTYHSDQLFGETHLEATQSQAIKFENICLSILSKPGVFWKRYGILEGGLTTYPKELLFVPNLAGLIKNTSNAKTCAHLINVTFKNLVDGSNKRHAYRGITLNNAFQIGQEDKHLYLPDRTTGLSWEFYYASSWTLSYEIFRQKSSKRLSFKQGTINALNPFKQRPYHKAWASHFVSIKRNVGWFPLAYLFYYYNYLKLSTSDLFTQRSENILTPLKITTKKPWCILDGHSSLNFRLHSLHYRNNLTLSYRKKIFNSWTFAFHKWFWLWVQSQSEIIPEAISNVNQQSIETKGSNRWTSEEPEGLLFLGHQVPMSICANYRRMTPGTWCMGTSQSKESRTYTFNSLTQRFQLRKFSPGGLVMGDSGNRLSIPQNCDYMEPLTIIEAKIWLGLATPSRSNERIQNMNYFKIIQVVPKLCQCEKGLPQNMQPTWQHLMKKDCDKKSIYPQLTFSPKLMWTSWENEGIFQTYIYGWVANFNSASSPGLRKLVKNQGSFLKALKTWTFPSNWPYLAYIPWEGGNHNKHYFSYDAPEKTFDIIAGLRYMDNVVEARQSRTESIVTDVTGLVTDWCPHIWTVSPEALPLWLSIFTPNQLKVQKSSSIFKNSLQLALLLKPSGIKKLVCPKIWNDKIVHDSFILKSFSTTVGFLFSTPHKTSCWPEIPDYQRYKLVLKNAMWSLPLKYKHLQKDESGKIHLLINTQSFRQFLDLFIPWVHEQEGISLTGDNEDKGGSKQSFGPVEPDVKASSQMVLKLNSSKSLRKEGLSSRSDGDSKVGIAKRKRKPTKKKKLPFKINAKSDYTPQQLGLSKGKFILPKDKGYKNSKQSFSRWKSEKVAQVSGQKLNCKEVVSGPKYTSKVILLRSSRCQETLNSQNKIFSTPRKPTQTWNNFVGQSRLSKDLMFPKGRSKEMLKSLKRTVKDSKNWPSGAFQGVTRSKVRKMKQVDKLKAKRHQLEVKAKRIVGFLPEKRSTSKMSKFYHAFKNQDQRKGASDTLHEPNTISQTFSINRNNKKIKLFSTRQLPTTKNARNFVSTRVQFKSIVHEKLPNPGVSSLNICPPAKVIDQNPKNEIVVASPTAEKVPLSGSDFLKQVVDRKPRENVKIYLRTRKADNVANRIQRSYSYLGWLQEQVDPSNLPKIRLKLRQMRASLRYLGKDLSKFELYVKLKNLSCSQSLISEIKNLLTYSLNRLFWNKLQRWNKIYNPLDFVYGSKLVNFLIGEDTIEFSWLKTLTAKPFTWYYPKLVMLHRYQIWELWLKTHFCFYNTRYVWKDKDNKLYKKTLLLSYNQLRPEHSFINGQITSEGYWISYPILKFQRRVQIDNLLKWRNLYPLTQKSSHSHECKQLNNFVQNLRHTGVSEGYWTDNNKTFPALNRKTPKAYSKFIKPIYKFLRTLPKGSASMSKALKVVYACKVAEKHLAERVWNHQDQKSIHKESRLSLLKNEHFNDSFSRPITWNYFTLPCHLSNLDTLLPNPTEIVKGGDNIVPETLNFQTMVIKRFYSHYNFSTLFISLKYSQHYLQTIILESLVDQYKRSGIFLPYMHYEFLVRKMSSVVRVLDPGDTNLELTDILTSAEAQVLNRSYGELGFKLCFVVPLVLGMSRITLLANGVLGGYSARLVTATLIKASLWNQVDWIQDAKACVISGTQFESHQKY